MIVYLEDDRTMSDLWAFVLRDAGYKVHCFYDPDSFFEFLDHIPEDVCAFMIDIMIPLGSKIPLEESQGGIRGGFYVIEQVKKKYLALGRECVPVIAVTIIDGFKPELEAMGVEFISKRRNTPSGLLEVVSKLNIQPEQGVR